MRLIFKYCKEMICKYPRLFLCSLSLIFAITFFNTLIPFGLRYFISYVISTNNYLVVILGALSFIACMSLNTLMEMKWYVILDKLGGKCIEDISIKIESALAYTSQKYIDEVKPEMIKHSLYADVLDIFRVIGHHIPNFIGKMTTIIVSCILAFFYDLKLALFIIIASILGMLLSFASRKMIALKAGKTNLKLKAHHALCNHFIDSLPLVQTNPVLPYFHAKTKASINDFIVTSQSEDNIVIFWTKIVSNYNILVTIILSALLVLPSSGGTITNLVFFTMLSGMISSQSQSAELLLQQIIKADISFRNVDRLRNLPKRNGNKAISHINDICLDHVCFSYNESDSPIFNDLSCHIASGDNIYLHGTNGSGKSTFIKLLLGIYMPSSGHVFVNGSDIASYSQDSINKNVLYINQDETFLNETIEDYLSIVCNRDISSDEIYQLLHKVDLSDPKRNIINGGLSLSVGQRKKLLIAKMLERLTEASVIIIDEIEAGLDLSTRELYLSYLKEMFEDKNKIVIIIEHDVNKQLKFDKVFDFCDHKIICTDGYS